MPAFTDTMEPNKNCWRMTRAGFAALVGLLLLAVELRNAAGHFAGPLHEGQHRWGPCVVYPGTLITIVCVAAISVGCTLFGIWRKKPLEIIGWILLAIHSIFVFAA